MPMMNKLLKDLGEDPPESEGELRSLLSEHGYDLVMASDYDADDADDEDDDEYDGKEKSVFKKGKSPRAQLAVFRIEAARNANDREA
jgi:hypothetical protein